MSAVISIERVVELGNRRKWEVALDTIQNGILQLWANGKYPLVGDKDCLQETELQAIVAKSVYTSENEASLYAAGNGINQLDTSNETW